MSICPLDEWTLSNGDHFSLLSTWGQTESDYVITASLHCNMNKCPFVHWTNRNVHWTFICPFVHWTNRNVHWTFKCPFVRWTNRNVHWTFKCPFVHWANRNAIGHSNVHSSIGPTEMSIGHKYMSIHPLDK